VLVFGAGVSTGFAQKVIASKRIGNFASYSEKIGGVLLVGAGLYLLVILI
jgi:hypothetical protein